MQRLNKFIASSGFCSRRKADEYIENGDVVVNGRIIKELGFQVGPKDKVSIEGKLIKPLKNEYYRFYKPAGYITTKSDEKGRKTIYDILPDEVKHLKAIGRLDKESTGLIILTNDGDLINKLAHPSVKIPKKYRVTTDGEIKVEHLQEFAKGIKLEGKLAWCDSEILEKNKGITTLEITLYQGLNRQIRKMFAHFGFKVLSLKRINGVKM
jgi:23S rRNA pseudouridine2605 synthase